MYYVYSALIFVGTIVIMYLILATSAVISERQWRNLMYRYYGKTITGEIGPSMIKIFFTLGMGKRT